MDLAASQADARPRGLLSDLGVAGIGLRSVKNIAADHELLRARRSGKIIVEYGGLRSVCGRWWPHCGNMMQVLWDMNFRPVCRDRCELYYHIPWGAPGFITLSYVHSGPATSMGTLYAGALVLDEIARLKQSQAIVCHVTNDRISDRILTRWGWQQHCLDWAGRHFIKRFYGKYPAVSSHWSERLTFGR